MAEPRDEGRAVTERAEAAVGTAGRHCSDTWRGQAQGQQAVLRRRLRSRHGTTGKRMVPPSSALRGRSVSWPRCCCTSPSPPWGSVFGYDFALVGRSSRDISTESRTASSAHTSAQQPSERARAPRGRTGKRVYRPLPPPGRTRTADRGRTPCTRFTLAPASSLSGGTFRRIARRPRAVDLGRIAWYVLSRTNLIG